MCPLIRASWVILIYPSPLISVENRSTRIVENYMTGALLVIIAKHRFSPPVRISCRNDFNWGQESRHFPPSISLHNSMGFTGWPYMLEQPMCSSMNFRSEYLHPEDSASHFPMGLKKQLDFAVPHQNSDAEPWLPLVSSCQTLRTIWGKRAEMMQEFFWSKCLCFE